MTQVIEIEMRGPVLESQLLSLKSKLKECAQFVERKNRILIDYSTLIPEQGIEKRNTDIRLRNTNGVSEIITKTGSWGGSDVRREYKATVAGSFDTLVQIYRFLGYSRGVLCMRNIDVYKYKNVEITLVEVPEHSYFFEAEIEQDGTDNLDSIKEQLEETLRFFELQVFSDTEYFAYIEKLNKEANTIFDAEVEPEEHFKVKFNI